MSDHEKYVPGPAVGAEVQKDGEKWTLILVRQLRHPPAMVWQALTDPAHLSEWAPFDAVFWRRLQATRRAPDRAPPTAQVVGQSVMDRRE